jgi:hypothetical protein
MKNLTELKHYLTLPKAALRMVSLEWFMNGEWVNIQVKPELAQFRFVSRVQTNAVELFTGDHVSRLAFGRACDWAFDKSQNLAFYASDTDRLTYQWANLAIVEGTDEWNRLELEGGTNER